MSNLLTVNPDALAVLSATPADLRAVVFSPGGALQQLPLDLLLARLIATDRIFADRAGIDADLAHPENTVGLVINDPTALQNGWYRKVGASGFGSWSQFEELSKSARAAAVEAAANAGTSLARAQNSVPFTSWATLAAATSMSGGDRASVLISDTGTHTDPVAGGTVDNAGTYQYSESPAGWERVGDLDSQTASGFAKNSLVSKTNALSTGDRTSLLQVNSSGFTAGSNGNLVNGINAGTDAGGRRVSSGNDATDISVELTPRDSLPRIFRSLTLHQTTTGTAGTFKVQGRAKDGSYSDIVTGQVIGGATSTEITLSDTASYYGLKIVGTSGTASGTYWWTEIELDVGFSNDGLALALADALDFSSGALSQRLGASRRAIEDQNAALIPPDQYVDPYRLEGSANTTLATAPDAGGNKVNADGTLTIGAGSYIEYPTIGADGDYDPDGFYYFYAVPKDPARAGDLDVLFFQTDVAQAPLEFSVDRSTYGVLKCVYRNRRTSNGLAFNSIFPRLYNRGATNLEIYRPSLTRTDSDRLWHQMLERLVESDVVTMPEIRTFEFWKEPGFFDLDLHSYLANCTLAVDSVRGDDANAGTRFSPKQTLAGLGAQGTTPDEAVYLFANGSVWNEPVLAFAASNAEGVSFVADARDDKSGMPKITGFVAVDDANITDNGDGTFSFTFVPPANNHPALDSGQNNGYHTIGVRERNAALDAKGKELEAGYSLLWRASAGEMAGVDACHTASYDSGTNTWTVTFKPRAGTTPKTGTHTYEVTNISQLIRQRDGTPGTEHATFIGLHLDGSTNGYGMLTAGTGSKLDFCVLSGGYTHHLVCGSVRVDRSLVFSTPNVPDTPITAYAANGVIQGTVSGVSRSWVFADSPGYAHNDVDWARPAKLWHVVNSHVYAERKPDTNQLIGSLSTADQHERAIMRDTYARNIGQVADRLTPNIEDQPVYKPSGLYIEGVAKVAAIRSGLTDSIFIGANEGDRVSPGNKGVGGIFGTPGGSFTNNLVVITHEDGNFAQPGNSNYLSDYGGTAIQASALGNWGTVEKQWEVRRNIIPIYLPFAGPNGQSTNISICGQTTYGNVIHDENIFILLDPGTDVTVSGARDDLGGLPLLIPTTGTGGTADAITLTTGQSLAVNPVNICFTPSASNTGRATISVDGLSAVAIKDRDGNDLTANELSAGTRYSARFEAGEYRLNSFQTYAQGGHRRLRAKTGMEQNGHIIDARGHPLGLDAVFRDFANRDLRLANTDIGRMIERINRERIKDGLLPCGPSWTVNRRVQELKPDEVREIISRRALVA